MLDFQGSVREIFPLHNTDAKLTVHQILKILFESDVCYENNFAFIQINNCRGKIWFDG